jgi:death-on-curing protein
MIDIEAVLIIHETLIKKYGGSAGVRDINLLKSALERPFSGMGQDEFYPTVEEKSAALIESIISNHPFIDGNKRTGFVLMSLFLLEYGKDIKAEWDEKYDFVIQIASGQIDYPEILAWIRARLY